MPSQRKPDPLSDFDRLPGSANVRLPVVMALFAHSAASVWRRAADPDDDFPKPRKLGPNITGWNVAELRKYQAKVAA